MPRARLTAEMLGELVGLLRGGTPLEDACTEVGISPRTLERWRARGRKADEIATDSLYARLALKVAEALEVAKERGPMSERELEAVLEQAARDGSHNAALALLRARHPEKWAPRRTGKEPPPAPPASGMDELERRRQERAQEEGGGG